MHISEKCHTSGPTYWYAITGRLSCPHAMTRQQHEKETEINGSLVMADGSACMLTVSSFTTEGVSTIISLQPIKK